MSNPVIKVEQISKQYRLGNIGTGSLGHDINRWLHRIKGKEDPYLKIGEANDRSKKGESEYVWALQDISFDVQPGEVLGIIGRNGAGKSTLLKILSRTTSPTTGGIKIKGRVASLLEVGTGFHPDLSGRENIYLNGAILGMRRKEIDRKFDAIVEFAGVERYIDTPVKRYSSGMYVRLAFAVAAHLDPEILIVDEVLAVGDIEFQKKCLGKMKDVSTNEGKTVLFVSHNLGAIRQLCTRGILLENGMLATDDTVLKVLLQYAQPARQAASGAALAYRDAGIVHHKKIELLSLRINGENNGPVILSETENQLQIDCRLQCSLDSFIALEARIKDEAGNSLASFSNAQYNGVANLYKTGEAGISVLIKLPPGILKGQYILDLYLTHPGHEYHFSLVDQVIIDHQGFTTLAGQTLEYRQGFGWLLLN